MRTAALLYPLRACRPKGCLVGPLCGGRYTPLYTAGGYTCRRWASEPAGLGEAGAAEASEAHPRQRLRQQRQGVVHAWTTTYETRGGRIHETTQMKEREHIRGSATSIFPSLRALPSRVLQRLDVVVGHLLPKGCNSGSVRHAYFKYVSWYSLACVAGSMSMVFSTQSMLYGVGLGAGAIPVAAALSWVLKDGIGQLGGVVFASMVNTNFDADPKRWRFIAGFLLDLAALLEALIPFAPWLFLPLASLSNGLKNVSFLAASASRASIHSSFALKGNLADVTAKAGAQTTVAATVGTALGAAVSAFAGSDCVTILGCVVASVAVHITALTMAIGIVPVATLNLQRFELIGARYARTADVAAPEDIADLEVFLGPRFHNVLHGHCGSVVVGPDLHDMVADTGVCLDDLRADLSDHGYCVSVSHSGKPYVVIRSDLECRGTLQAVYDALLLTVPQAERAENISFDDFHAKLIANTWHVKHALVEGNAARVSLV